MLKLLWLLLHPKIESEIDFLQALVSINIGIKPILLCFQEILLVLKKYFECCIFVVEDLQLMLMGVGSPVDVYFQGV